MQTNGDVSKLTANASGADADSLTKQMDNLALSPDFKRVSYSATRRKEEQEKAEKEKAEAIQGGNQSKHVQASQSSTSNFNYSKSLPSYLVKPNTVRLGRYALGDNYHLSLLHWVLKDPVTIGSIKGMRPDIHARFLRPLLDRYNTMCDIKKREGRCDCRSGYHGPWVPSHVHDMFGKLAFYIFMHDCLLDFLGRYYPDLLKFCLFEPAFKSGLVSRGNYLMLEICIADEH
jgi:hypothetical protein